MFLGEVSVANDPCGYLAAAQQLVTEYRRLARTDPAPLLVNTMGWANGQSPPSRSHAGQAGMAGAVISKRKPMIGSHGPESGIYEIIDRLSIFLMGSIVFLKL